MEVEAVTQQLAQARSDREGSDFRAFLQGELVRRCKANPRYSLRAFAQFLSVEPSRLSKMLRGQRPLRPPFIEKFGTRLGIHPSQIEAYKAKVKPAPGAASASAKPTTQEFRQLSLDTFEAIADWRHYAILELMKVKGFRPDARWVAKALGGSLHEIRDCIERLVRVGLLEVAADGGWQDRSEGASTHVLGENYTSYAHRKAQEEILQLAIHALHRIPIEQRDQSSMMMATHTGKIQEAKLMIKRFRRELAQFLEDVPEKNVVFQLGVSLFPLMDPNPSGEP
jgi:uncharacterized protein (TIGR02147 family)